MSRHRQFVCGLVFSTLLALPAAAQAGVQWMQDIESAKAVAQQSGRLVLVHFWTPECVPCRALDLNVFSQPSVAAAVESQFVPVKLNANENPGTAQGFGITQVPTDVVLTPDGRVVAMSISPSAPSTYVAGLTQVARQYAGSQHNTYAAASQPAQVNSAYANLPINSQPPATPQQSQPAASNSPYTWPASQTATTTPASPPARYASSYQTPGVNPQVTPTQQPNVTQTWPAAPASTTPPASVQNPYAQPQAAYSQAQPSYGQAQQPSYTQPQPSYAQPQPSYAQPQPSYAQAQGSPAPSQTLNPYTAGPVAQSQPPATTRSAQMAAQQPVAPPATPDASQLPAGAPPLGFEGYCPVSMRNQWKWLAGDPQWGAIHRGRTYWFAGQREQQQFLSNPDYYSPALAGIDAVLALDHGQMVPGSREHALDYDNQFYLFSSEATLQQFTTDPARYAEQVRQAMAGTTGQIVR